MWARVLTILDAIIYLVKGVLLLSEISNFTDKKIVTFLSKMPFVNRCG